MVVSGLACAPRSDADGCRWRARSKRVEPLDGHRFRVIGDLTIRDVTREVALETTLEGRTTDPWGSERVGFSARTTINRQDFGLNWNQALEAGGILVGNDVKISIEIEAVKRS
jgi:polyisoprenoid-binding protein YceI